MCSSLLVVRIVTSVVKLASHASNPEVKLASYAANVLKDSILRWPEGQRINLAHHAICFTVKGVHRAAETYKSVTNYNIEFTFITASILILLVTILLYSLTIPSIKLTVLIAPISSE